MCLGSVFLLSNSIQHLFHAHWLSLHPYCAWEFRNTNNSKIIEESKNIRILFWLETCLYLCFLGSYY